MTALINVDTFLLAFSLAEMAFLQRSHPDLLVWWALQIVSVFCWWQHVRVQCACVRVTVSPFKPKETNALYVYLAMEYSQLACSIRSLRMPISLDTMSSRAWSSFWILFSLTASAWVCLDLWTQIRFNNPHLSWRVPTTETLTSQRWSWPAELSCACFALLSSSALVVEAPGASSPAWNQTQGETLYTETPQNKQKR